MAEVQEEKREKLLMCGKNNYCLAVTWEEIFYLNLKLYKIINLNLAAPL